MFLQHESTIKTIDGAYEITVFIVNGDKRKRYTYLVGSEFITRRFASLYRSRKTHGKALALLNKAKIKEEGEK